MGQTGHIYHDDIQGIVGTAVGTSALGTITIRDTGFPILAFQNANDDTLYMVYQMPHRKKLGVALDSVHLHCYLPSAPSAGQTVLIDYEYTWYNNDNTIPALVTWIKSTKTHTFTGTELQYSTPIITVIQNLTAPTNETYSSILLVKLTRNSTGVGSDTYNDDLGLVYSDIHVPIDKNGSMNEFND